MTDPRQLLESSTTILLVDWPNTGIPRALLSAGLAVFGYSPNRFSIAQVVPDRPDGVEARVFPPERPGEDGFLVFRPIDARPAHVDLVTTYRPSSELPAIVENLVLPLGARALWLQPPTISAEARQLAARYGLDFVDGTDIAEVANAIRIARL
jgi:predicted CoA-binding protein